MRLLWRAWITLAAVIVLLAAKPAVAQNCACVPPVNAGYGIREYLHIGIDPAVAQNSNYTNAFIDGANYWNTYWNNHGIQLGFLMDGAYGAADINVTVDPSLIGTGFGAVNTHDVNGRGTIRLNPEFYGNDPLMYKIAAHELGHSTGFGELTQGDCGPADSAMTPANTSGPWLQSFPTCGDRQGLGGHYGDNQADFDNGRCTLGCSPIILDLKGGGLSLTAPTVPFDLVGRGHRQMLGWLPGDSSAAFLALDRDGNGRIDSGRELFGTFTPVGWTVDGARAADGFAALRWFDDPRHGGDGDGRLTSSDAVFEHLLLWIDANRNGLSEPAELQTLAQVGIVSIELNAEKQCDIDSFGNELTLRAPFEMIVNGHVEKRWAYDVFLATSSASTSHMTTAEGGRRMHGILTALMVASASTAMHSPMFSPATPTLAVGAGAVQATGALPQSPPVLQEVDSVDPPEELGQFVSMADAVAHVQVLQSRTYATPNGLVFTEHTVKVLEPLKVHPQLRSAGATMTVLQRAGRATVGDHVVEVPENRVFLGGERYVLFLHWNSSMQAFEIQNGKHGVFEVAGNSVEVGGGSVLGRAIRGMNRDQFLASLRVLGGGKSK